MIVAAGCSGAADTTTGSDASTEDSAATNPEAVTQVVALCDSVVALHSSIIDLVNDMSSREVEATPTDRATILADGIDGMIELAEQVDLATEPAALTGGMDQRREQAIADLRVEAEVFRSTNQSVEQDERGGAVNRVFLLAEKLMSETEPNITVETPDELIEAARDTRSCRFVVQLPPDR